MMRPPANFLESLKTFDKDAILPAHKAALKTADLLGSPIFTYEIMMKKSSAAANLANWVINVVRYNDIFVEVVPLKKEAEESKALAD
jgi:dynein heavy chain